GCNPLLIDTCGGFEFSRQLARIGQPIGGLHDVVVTHQHMDHIGGVPALYIASVPLTFYALPETLAGMRPVMHGWLPESLSGHHGISDPAGCAGDRCGGGGAVRDWGLYGVVLRCRTSSADAGGAGRAGGEGARIQRGRRADRWDGCLRASRPSLHL